MQLIDAARSQPEKPRRKARNRPVASPDVRLDEGGANTLEMTCGG